MSGTAAFVAGRATPAIPASHDPDTARAIGRGLTASALAHVLVIVGLVVAARAQPRSVAPPVYRVALVSAPAGPSRPSGPANSAASTVPRPAAPPNAAPRSRPNAKPNVKPAHAPRPVAAVTHAAATHLAATHPAAAHPPAAHSAAPHSAAAHPVAAHPPAVAPPARPVPTAKPATPPAKAAPRPMASAPKVVNAPEASATRPAPERPAEHGGGAGTATARGHDVADVRVVGLAFPYPGYLDNLVRQVRLRFEPTDPRAGLHADLTFVVARDGSISGLRVVRSSGNYTFDLEAQGAVEAAGSARAFGPLPDGFHGTMLPVTFSFDPRPTP